MREAKFWFNPCLYNECVYMCGYPFQLMEALIPQTDSFLPLQCRLPEYSNYCLYVHNQVLVVHSSQYITKFAVGQTGQLVQHSLTSSETAADKYSNSHPMVDPTCGLFFIFQGGKALCFNMETGAEVQSYS